MLDNDTGMLQVVTRDYLQMMKCVNWSVWLCCHYFACRTTLYLFVCFIVYLILPHRTVVIERLNANQHPLACAPVEQMLQYNSRLLRALAVFRSPIHGVLVLEQEQFRDGQLDDTLIMSTGLAHLSHRQVWGYC